MSNCRATRSAKHSDAPTRTACAGRCASGKASAGRATLCACGDQELGAVLDALGGVTDAKLHSVLTGLDAKREVPRIPDAPKWKHEARVIELLARFDHGI